LVVGLCLAAGGPAAAQTTTRSTLWREWSTLHRQWIEEQQVLEADRVRFEARRRARQAGGTAKPAERPKESDR
jgi:hypothetical protein